MAKVTVGPLVLKDDDGFMTGNLKLVHFATALGAKKANALVEQETEYDDDEKPVIANEVRAGIEWLVKNERAAAKAVVSAIYAKHTDLGDKPSKRIKLQSVKFHDAVRANEPYIGFLFSCDWDDEHGLGVMMHGTRLVQIGGADTAILEWIADRDARAGKSKKTATKKKAASKKTAARKKTAR